MQIRVHCSCLSCEHIVHNVSLDDATMHIGWAAFPMMALIPDPVFVTLSVFQNGD